MIDIVLGVGIFIIMHANQLIGLILPPFVDVLNRDVPNEQERFIVALLLCIGLAVLTQWNSLIGGSPMAIATTASLIFFESQIIFKLYFKNSFLRKKLKEEVINTNEPIGRDSSI